MRTLLFTLLCFAFASCNDDSMSHRSSYVISKSHQAAADAEAVTEPPAD